MDGGAWQAAVHAVTESQTWLHTHRDYPESEGMDKDIPCKWKLKESWSSLFKNKTGVKSKTIIRDKESHYIMIKRSIHQENIIFINIYAPNIGASKYGKQILTDLKGKTDSNAIIEGNFSIPLSKMERSSRQKSASKHTGLKLHVRLDGHNIFIYRTSHSAAEYISKTHMDHSAG